MKITSSYGVELRKQNIPIRQTLDVYRSAVGYLTEIYAQVWEELERIPGTKKRFNEAEHLIHTTKKNQARFDFDIRFPKMPSYLRRASIQNALGRKFINFHSEKDRMYRVLGQIRRFQREHGSVQVKSRWAYAKRLNTELGRKIAGAVTKYAKENHADIIVFEYLETKGKISGRKKQKLHLWKKRDIQKRCEHQAHRNGMRISRICAWNTSRLAYDGTGTVVRDPKNHSLCVFQTGKRYNCDLSASYNIGARYFIRELLKPLPVTERSLLEAKVPAVKRRTSCVYADLRKLSSEMNLRAA